MGFNSGFKGLISREFSTFSFVSTNPELKFTKRQLHLLFHAGAEFGFFNCKETEEYFESDKFLCRKYAVANDRRRLDDDRLYNFTLFK